ncbi:hypothetical protein MPSEU_001017200 [Mayamaea pseudoterrestris]|nr:hypothetical protein MPSEU_001017200 [Mayamaea pseudoterrestris]
MRTIRRIAASPTKSTMASSCAANDPPGCSSSYPTGSTVPFPYENPYPQQIALMDTILQSLAQPAVVDKTKRTQQRCRVLMLESPTGTGKSLSLACASMAWLRHVESQDLNESKGAISKSPNSTLSTGIDWLDSFVSPQQREMEQAETDIRAKAQQARKDLVDELARIQNQLGGDSQKRQHVLRSALVQMKQDSRQSHNFAKRKRNEEAQPQQQQSDIDFVMEGYQSDGDTKQSEKDDDDENDFQWTSKRTPSHAGLLLNGAALDGSIALRNAHASLSPNIAPIGGVKPSSGVRKIIYSARTHSQLSQFVSELRRTAWGKSVRVVALGGRKTLCGNKDLLSKYKIESAINDACLDLKKSSSSSCPLLANGAVDTLALHLLAQPTDIEEAASIGSKVQTCAYYASRAALAAAEVVVLPYSMLLSKQSRASIGLSLAQSFVIVDEAHNLPEALRALHTSRLSLPVVQSALDQLAAYTTKYIDRLAGRNLHYLGQLRRILVQIQKYLGLANKQTRDSMMTSDELLYELRLANVNLYKILRYMEKSRLAQKLLGFTSYRLEKAKQGVKCSTNDAFIQHDDGLSKHVSAMSLVETFLEKLSGSSKEGKIVVDLPNEASLVQHPTLRYVLLNPATFFDPLLTEAYAVALVGGTLRPFVHVAAELLGHENVDVIRDAASADEMMQRSNKLSEAFISPTFTAFTCDHVVASSNVLLQCMSTGVTGKTLDFRHHARSTTAVCDELGLTLLKMSSVVPNGLVLFLPSYAYEICLVTRWKATGVWDKLELEKAIHREPKNAQMVEVSLQAYAADAATERGALLLSVIGGKLSEGINFSNEMARCVAVVGLPYPDITDPELKEKMTAMDRSSAKTVTGRDYYNNLCMRAVNQSIGRAIRHANDYAAIVLLDSRYLTDTRVWNGLPHWLKKGAKNECCQQRSFDHRLGEIRSFFARRTC